MKISIITVSYNSAKTIVQTIDSVLHQTYKDIEYIIVDGASTDDTLAIIESYQEAFSGRMSCISEPDRGIYDAMNKGIQRATGDIIGILNSDDFFTSNDVIEQMVQHFTDNIDAIYGDVHFVKHNQLDKCVRYYSGKLFKPGMVKFGFIAPHPSFYIRKQAFIQYGYYDTQYQISADFELIARFCYLHHIKTKYLHLDFVTMRFGGESTRNLQSHLNGLKETITACRKLGLKTNKIFVCCKYFIKLYSSIFIR